LDTGRDPATFFVEVTLMSSF